MQAPGGASAAAGDGLMTSMLTAMVLSSPTMRDFGFAAALRMAATNWAVTRGLPAVDRGVVGVATGLWAWLTRRLPPQAAPAGARPPPPPEQTLVMRECSMNLTLLVPILWHICERTAAARHLAMSHTCVAVPLAMEREVIADDIACSVHLEKSAKAQDDDDVVVTLASASLSAAELKGFVDRLRREHCLETSNRLGGGLWIFDQHPPTCCTYPPTSCFVRHPFSSTRTLDNVFLNGDLMAQLRTHLDHFMDNPQWYQRTGVPRALGILLTGPPGTGKTSLVKALANHTRRHVLNVQLDLVSNKEELEMLFHSDTLYDSKARSHFELPVNRRIYVLEDVDCTRCKAVRRRNELAPGDDGTKVRRPRLGASPPAHAHATHRRAPAAAAGGESGGDAVGHSERAGRHPRAAGSHHRDDHQPPGCAGPRTDPAGPLRPAPGAGPRRRRRADRHGLLLLHPGPGPRGPGHPERVSRCADAGRGLRGHPADGHRKAQGRLRGHWGTGAVQEGPASYLTSTPILRGLYGRRRGKKLCGATWTVSSSLPLGCWGVMRQGDAY